MKIIILHKCIANRFVQCIMASDILTGIHNLSLICKKATVCWPCRLMQWHILMKGFVECIHKFQTNFYRLQMLQFFFHCKSTRYGLIIRTTSRRIHNLCAQIIINQSTMFWTKLYSRPGPMLTDIKVFHFLWWMNHAFADHSSQYQPRQILRCTH